MAVLVGASWMLDLRLLGFNRRIPLSAYRWVFPTIGIGLFVNVITGVMLFMKRASTWGTAMAISSIAAWLAVLYAGRMLPFLGRSF